MTGPSHSGVELHGFLSYIVKSNLKKIPYKIFGYKGKQVRDNIHSTDVSKFINEFVSVLKKVKFTILEVAMKIHALF